MVRFVNFVEENRLCQNDVVIVLQSIREFGPYHIFYWFGSKASKKKKGTFLHCDISILSQREGVAVEKLVPELDDIFGGLYARFNCYLRLYSFSDARIIEKSKATNRYCFWRSLKRKMVNLLNLNFFLNSVGILILDIQGKSTQIQTNLDDFKVHATSQMWRLFQLKS